jgi:hypothetical protein
MITTCFDNVTNWSSSGDTILAKYFELQTVLSNIDPYLLDKIVCNSKHQ